MARQGVLLLALVVVLAATCAHGVKLSVLQRMRDNAAMAVEPKSEGKPEAGSAEAEQQSAEAAPPAETKGEKENDEIGLQGEVSELAANAKNLNDAIAEVKAGKLDAIAAEEKLLGKTPDGQPVKGPDGKVIEPEGKVDPKNEDSPKKSEDAYKNVPQEENLGKLIKNMEKPHKFQEYTDGQLLSALRGLEVLPPPPGAPRHMKKKPLKRHGDNTVLHYRPDASGVLHLPYSLVPGENAGPSKTALDGDQVDRVARIVLSHARVAKCQRKNEYGELILSCDPVGGAPEASGADSAASAQSSSEAKESKDSTYGEIAKDEKKEKSAEEQSKEEDQEKKKVEKQEAIENEPGKKVEQKE